MDENFRKLYNKTLKESSKFQTSQSKCLFLKQCLDLNVVPITLRSKTNHQQFHEKTQAIWENDIKIQNRKQTKCAWTDEKMSCEKLKEKQIDLNNTLIDSVPSEFKNMLTQRIISKATSRYKQERGKHISNYFFLKLKLKFKSLNVLQHQFKQIQYFLMVYKGTTLRKRKDDLFNTTNMFTENKNMPEEN